MTMQCPICNEGMKEVFRSQVMFKYDVGYHCCATCGYLCTDQPYWLPEAYASPIALSDTGILQRNYRNAQKLSALLCFVLGERGNGKWLDFAAGYGLLVRLMRDCGIDFYWHDKYASNIFAALFEHREGTVYDGVTAIEVFEHAENPVALVSEIVALSGANVLIFTTETYQGAPPAPDAWWYYSRHSGQHISFFQERTLAMLAKKFGFEYVRCNALHIFTRKKIPAVLARLLTAKNAILARWFVGLVLRSKTQGDSDAGAEIERRR